MGFSVIKIKFELQYLASGFEVVLEKHIDILLLYAASIGDRWVVATIHVREWGSPAFIEEWRWDNLECERKIAIDLV